ncbi:MAG: hypothetical protein WC792_01210 [Candidatus Micrarchaeia archaeon]
MPLSAADDLKRELPHVIALLVLLLVLLIVLTKFKWVHASQVPGNWHDVYCGDICLGNVCFGSLSGGKSRVGLIYDELAMGDWRTLYQRVSNERLFTLIEPIPEFDVSSGLLSNYELVILHNKRITLKEARAVEDYLGAGGTVLMIGDAATEYYLSAEELAEAELMEQSKPGWYVFKINETKAQKGFGILANQLGAQYLGGENQTTFEVKTVLRQHLIMASFPEGLKGLNEMPFAKVVASPAYTTKLANIVHGNSTGYPAILETKLGLPFFGRTYMMYVAFPIENAGPGSKTLLQNIMDYLVVC